MNGHKLGRGHVREMKGGWGVKDKKNLETFNTHLKMLQNC
jgi:hypothetical protein